MKYIILHFGQSESNNHSIHCYFTPSPNDDIDDDDDNSSVFIFPFIVYNIVLISEKYAGYPMLVATILAEISDDKLFSYGTQKSEDQTENTDTTTTNNSQSSTSNNKNRSNETVENAVLLVAATELTYETVVTSVLNAEELRRENGIPVLQKAFSQCSNFLSRTSSRPGHIVVEVCGHIVSVLAAASLFPSSRQCIQETPQLLKDTLRLLYYKVSFVSKF